jgi:hypothetical protein
VPEQPHLESGAAGSCVADPLPCRICKALALHAESQALGTWARKGAKLAIVSDDLITTLALESCVPWLTTRGQLMLQNVTLKMEIRRVVICIQYVLIHIGTRLYFSFATDGLRGRLKE